jgi:hypothetical protein
MRLPCDSCIARWRCPVGEAEHQRLSCHSPLPAEVKRELRHLYTSSGLMRRFWPMFRDVWAPDHPRYFDLTDLMRGWGRPPKLSTCPSPHRLRHLWWCQTRRGIPWRETVGDGLLRCGPLRLNWTLELGCIQKQPHPRHLVYFTADTGRFTSRPLYRSSGKGRKRQVARFGARKCRSSSFAIVYSAGT